MSTQTLERQQLTRDRSRYDLEPAVTYNLGDVDTDVLGLHDCLPQRMAVAIRPPIVRTAAWLMRLHPRSFSMAMLPSVIRLVTISATSAGVSDNYDNGLVVTTSGLANLDVDVLKYYTTSLPSVILRVTRRPPKRERYPWWIPKIPSLSWWAMLHRPTN